MSCRPCRSQPPCGKLVVQIWEKSCVMLPAIYQTFQAPYDYLIVSTGEAQEAQEAQSSPTNVFPLILTIPFIVLTTLDIILTTMMQLIPPSGRLFRPREI